MGLIITPDSYASLPPASGVSALLTTPSSANLRTALTDELGTGAALFDGATLTQTLILATNSTSIAALNIPAGTLKTTSSDGDIEADGNCFYGSTDAGNRGYIPVRHFIRADSTVTYANDTNAHPIFTTPTNGRLTLETGTYLVKGILSFSSMSVTSGNLSLDLLGTGSATAGAWLWRATGIDGTTASAGQQTGSTAVTNASPQPIVTAAGNANCQLEIYGTFEITVAGTIVPSLTQNAASAAVLAIGSHLIFERIGSTSVTSVGQWD